MVAKAMNFKVYVLYSDSLKRYYAGYTKDLEERIQRHNSGRSKYTSRGIPWKLVKVFDCKSRSEAILLEKKIKARGIQRYLEENNSGI